MARLQCDYAAASARALGELARTRVHPNAVGMLVALPLVLFAALLVALFTAFRGPRGLDGTLLLEGLGLVTLTGLVLAFVSDRSARRAARSSLTALARQVPLCSFESPSDGFVFFTERGFFRERSLRFVKYYAAGGGVNDVRYDASARCLRVRGRTTSHRGISPTFRLELELPPEAPYASILESVAAIAEAAERANPGSRR
jgi:hypothetical protein